MGTIGRTNGMARIGRSLRASGENTGLFEADFTEMPDLALTFIVACCLKDIPFHIRGWKLCIKECDRVAASIHELRKLGYELKISVHGELCWNQERNTLISLEIDTYQDHRMAMAAPAGLKISRVSNSQCRGGVEVLPYLFGNNWAIY